jgi:hypothetical protein
MALSRQKAAHSGIWTQWVMCRKLWKSLPPHAPYPDAVRLFSKVGVRVRKIAAQPREG